MHAYISKAPRPGFVKCTDPTCSLSFGPHYREMRDGDAPDPLLPVQEEGAVASVTLLDELQGGA